MRLKNLFLLVEMSNPPLVTKTALTAQKSIVHLFCTCVEMALAGGKWIT